MTSEFFLNLLNKNGFSLVLEDGEFTITHSNKNIKPLKFKESQMREMTFFHGNSGTEEMYDFFWDILSDFLEKDKNETI